MKTIGLFLTFFCISSFSFAQRTIIDSNAYNKWPYLEYPTISDDGKYATFSIISRGENQIRTGIIHSTSSDWKIEIPNLKEGPLFTSDCSHVIFVTGNDSLGIVKMNTGVIIYKKNIASFKIPKSGSYASIIYKLKDRNSTVVFLDLKSGKETYLIGVNYYWISDDGKSLLILRKANSENSKQQILESLTIGTWKVEKIWEGENPRDFVIDFKHQQLVFRQNDTIIYHKKGMHSLSYLFSPKSSDTLKNIKLERFNERGDRLYFTIQKKCDIRPKVASDIVEVWSYNDIRLQPQQQREMNASSVSYLAFIELTDRKISILQKQKVEFFKDRFGDIVLSNHEHGGAGENNWNKKSAREIRLIDTRIGKSRTLSFMKDIQWQSIDISSSGKYIVYYNSELNNYFRYNVYTGELFNLTATIPSSWVYAEVNHKTERGIAAWVKNEEKIFIYDSHDIWKIDLTGKNLPVNLTNGYGIKHNVVFNLELVDPITKEIDNSEILLSAFNLNTKDNGFYKKDITKPGDPILLTMGPYLYKVPGQYDFLGHSFSPLKAKESKTYLIRRENAGTAPNYYSTEDFSTFRSLSNLHSQNAYNWYTSELHSWSSIDQKELKGILYKPLDFDPNKKYPVIFYCYEKQSDNLHAFLTPDFSEGQIDIPTYVSQGYLIFAPDIQYRIGDPMEGTYNAIVSAASYIKGLPYVNPEKLGVQGHSFGAIQINYLIACTDIFSAACSAAGLGDWVSAYGTLNYNKDYSLGNPEAPMFELGQNRMGTTLWDNSKGYIKNSAVLYCDKVKTPLLMEHGKKDGGVPYSNALEFFLGLRRLGKKVWLLVYPEADHTLSGINAKDFTIRTIQFFDHYLKNKPAALWMLNGIPAVNRGIDDGLKLDTLGRSPGPGLLTD